MPTKGEGEEKQRDGLYGCEGRWNMFNNVFTFHLVFAFLLLWLQL